MSYSAVDKNKSIRNR